MPYEVDTIYVHYVSMSLYNHTASSTGAVLELRPSRVLFLLIRKNIRVLKK